MNVFVCDFVSEVGMHELRYPQTVRTIVESPSSLLASDRYVHLGEAIRSSLVDDNYDHQEDYIYKDLPDCLGCRTHLKLIHG